MDTLQYGILSTSSIAPRFIDAVRRTQAGAIVALSSRTLEKAREKALQWNIPKAYGSHRELLEDPEVQVVYISTVNAQHYPWAKAAMEHGKHVICEKPCTTSSEQTRELFALAREKGLFFMEAEKMLFLPVINGVRERILRGDLGQIHMAQWSHSFPAGYNTWQFEPEAGGGTLLSSGIYVMQMLLWLFGPIQSIQGIRDTMPNGAECQYVLSGVTESGVMFTAKNSTKAILDNEARIYGSRGWVAIPDYWKARRAIFHIDGKEEELAIPCENELVYEAEHIRQCIQDGLLTSPVVTPELSEAGIAALERVKESWQ